MNEGQLFSGLLLLAMIAMAAGAAIFLATVTDRKR